MSLSESGAIQSLVDLLKEHQEMIIQHDKRIIALQKQVWEQRIEIFKLKKKVKIIQSQAEG